MPTKLKNLKIKRVALVDEGANPDAFIRFAKNKNAAEEADGGGMSFEQFAKGLFTAIVKMFGGHSVEKAAFTFAETKAKRDYDHVISSEIYPMSWAFMDSVTSILTDAQKSDENKEAMLKQSLSEFSSAFEAAIGNWSKAEEVNSAVENGDEVLVTMRNNISSLLEKKALHKADDDEEEKPEDDPDDQGGGSEPPVMKGVTDVKIDKNKMTPEERTALEEMEKKYSIPDGPAGQEEAAPPATVDTGVAAETNGDDVYKGLHPDVRVELENLRKFREESETREFMEIAKKYTLLGKKPEELAPLLKSLKKAGGSAYDDMIGILDGSLTAVENSGTFDEIGKRGTSTSGDAWSKIESAATEIMKSKEGMTWANAIDAACMAHPELVQAYEKSRN